MPEEFSNPLLNLIREQSMIDDLQFEEVVAEHTIHWPLAVGVAILAVVIFAPAGIAGLWRRPLRSSKGAA